jgi:AcrR family transcriptional regulator
MAEAGVNVAAVHYYFRSKESLLEAVLRRRVEPANQERLEALEECERLSSGNPLSVERILEAFLSPTFRMATDPDQGGYTFVRLLGRLQADSDLVPGNLLSWFGPVLLRFGSALAQALPELPPDELFLRARLAMGATAQLLRDAPRIRTRVPDQTLDWESMRARLIPFLSAGFRAPMETAALHSAASSQERI